MHYNIALLPKKGNLLRYLVAFYGKQCITLIFKSGQGFSHQKSQTEGHVYSRLYSRTQKKKVQQ